MRRVITIFLLLFFVTDVYAESCTMKHFGDSGHGEKMEVRGYYSSSFEHSGFKPCNVNENIFWWVDAKEEVYSALEAEISKIKSDRNSSNKSLYINAIACVSQEGSYGHMGAYKKHMEIIKLIKFNSPRKGDCK